MGGVGKLIEAFEPAVQVFTQGGGGIDNGKNIGIPAPIGDGMIEKDAQLIFRDEPSKPALSIIDLVAQLEREPGLAAPALADQNLD